MIHSSPEWSRVGCVVTVITPRRSQVGLSVTSLFEIKGYFSVATCSQRTLAISTVILRVVLHSKRCQNFKSSRLFERDGHQPTGLEGTTCGGNIRLFPLGPIPPANPAALICHTGKLSFFFPPLACHSQPLNSAVFLCRGSYTVHSWLDVPTP